MKDALPSEEVIAEIFSDVEEGRPNRKTNSFTPDASALKGAANTTGLGQTDGVNPPAGSQDSILDINGFWK